MKHITLSYALFPLLLCIYSLPSLGEDITETRAKDKEVIVSHVMGIAGNIINLVQEDKKSEDEIGANIVGLFGNILACIFAATKRSNIPFIMTKEEIDKLFASLDQELIDAVQKAVMTRAKQIRSL
jgi:hypothetical protein